MTLSRAYINGIRIARRLLSRKHARPAVGGPSALANVSARGGFRPPHVSTHESTSIRTMNYLSGGTRGCPVTPETLFLVINNRHLGKLIANPATLMVAPSPICALTGETGGPCGLAGKRRSGRRRGPGSGLVDFGLGFLGLDKRR